MNHIGETIKKLRLKNKLTQKMLADDLCISYQTISKWETGVAKPDIYMLAPIAKLFGITTDELLGVKSKNERKKEIWAKLNDFSRDNTEDLYKLLKSALPEFPDDPDFLDKISLYEFFLACEYKNKDEKISLDFLNESTEHLKKLLQCKKDSDMKNYIVERIVVNLLCIDEKEEAKKYAELATGSNHPSRDEILCLCLENEELFDKRKNILYSSILGFVNALQSIRDDISVSDTYWKTIIDFEEAFLKSLFNDENYLGFNLYFISIYKDRAYKCILNEEKEKAIHYIKLAEKYAQKYDSLRNTGIHTYSAPLISGCKFCDQSPLDENFYTNLLYEELSDPDFEKLHDNEEIKSMLSRRTN